MAKSKLRWDSETVEKLGGLLEFLNKHSFEYVSEERIRKALGGDYGGTISDAMGFNEKSAFISSNDLNHMSPFDRGKHYANLVQIRTTNLIQTWTNPKDNIPRFMITIKGIEVLNQIKSAKYVAEIASSSKRLEMLTGVLIIVTIVLAIIAVGFIHY